MSQVEEKQRRALEQIAEIKRVLCSAEHALQNKQPAALLVTSASHGEGKSLIAAAIAATAATMGKSRVIALDLNWYQPALHRFFGLELHQSSKTILDGEIRDLVHASGHESLDILCAPKDHSDHSNINGGVFNVANRLIERAKDAYDLVVVDSAAIFPTNRMMMDPVMLSGMVDGVAMVVLSAVTPRQKIKRAQKTMEIAGANVLGVITNQWKLSKRA